MNKKIKYFILSFTFLGLLTSNAFCAEESFFGIGAEIFKEPFNRKVIITNLLSGSSSSEAGIPIGSEIVSVDGNKVKKMSLCEVVSRIKGDEGTTVKLVIRNGWRWKKYELKRQAVTVAKPDIKQNEHFDMHWKQVVPLCMDCNQLLTDENVLKKLSRKYKTTILPVIEYWSKRKAKFEIGYNACMNYSKDMKEPCLMNLVNMENIKTSEDKKFYKVLRNDIK